MTRAPAAPWPRTPDPLVVDSFVSLLVWEGRTVLEVAAQAGHGVDVCEMYYARIFEGYDPAKRTSAEAAILAARRTEGRPMDVIRRREPARVTRNFSP